MSRLFEEAEFIAQAIQETRLDVRRNVVRVVQLLRGLAATDAAAASDLRREVIEFLTASAEPSTRARNSRGDNLVDLSAARQVHVSSASSDKVPEIEIDIMDILDGDSAGMHIDAIHDRLEDLSLGVTKGNLSVRLHRMMKSGRLMSTARGHYALSDAERTRRSHLDQR